MQSFSAPFGGFVIQEGGGENSSVNTEVCGGGGERRRKSPIVVTNVVLAFRHGDAQPDEVGGGETQACWASVQPRAAPCGSLLMWIRI